MQVFVNEIPMRVRDGCMVYELRDVHKPDADVLIVNGFPVSEDRPLNDGDSVALVQRGEIPSAEELEALMVARHTPGVHERVKSATVGIAGAGGLGSNVALALARLGIGRLVVADFDVVEPSNLNRQQYFVDQIGMPKVEALVANLRRVNPYVVVEAHEVRVDPENVSDLFATVDVMVEAFDTPAAKAMLAERFRIECPGIPLVAASGLAGFGPSDRIVTRRLGSDLYVVGDVVSAARPGEGLMAPRVGVAAHHQANLVLRLLLGEEWSPQEALRRESPREEAS